MFIFNSDQERYIPFSECVCFVWICPVFAGPVILRFNKTLATTRGAVFRHGMHY